MSSEFRKRFNSLYILDVQVLIITQRNIVHTHVHLEYKEITLVSSLVLCVIYKSVRLRQHCYFGEGGGYSRMFY